MRFKTKINVPMGATRLCVLIIALLSSTQLFAMCGLCHSGGDVFKGIDVYPPGPPCTGSPIDPCPAGHFFSDPWWQCDCENTATCLSCAASGPAQTIHYTSIYYLCTAGACVKHTDYGTTMVVPDATYHDTTCGGSCDVPVQAHDLVEALQPAARQGGAPHTLTNVQTMMARVCS